MAASLPGTARYLSGDRPPEHGGAQGEAPRLLDQPQRKGRQVRERPVEAGAGKFCQSVTRRARGGVEHRPALRARDGLRPYRSRFPIVFWRLRGCPLAMSFPLLLCQRRRLSDSSTILRVRVSTVILRNGDRSSHAGLSLRWTGTLLFSWPNRRIAVPLHRRTLSSLMVVASGLVRHPHAI